MVERKTKVQLPSGKTGDGFDVPILESNEKWSEFKLEDGSTLRVKLAVIAVIRAEGEWDPNGDPMYVVQMQPVMAVVEAPEKLKKPKKVN